MLIFGFSCQVVLKSWQLWFWVFCLQSICPMICLALSRKAQNRFPALRQKLQGKWACNMFISMHVHTCVLTLCTHIKVGAANIVQTSLSWQRHMEFPLFKPIILWTSISGVLPYRPFILSIFFLFLLFFVSLFCLFVFCFVLFFVCLFFLLKISKIQCRSCFLLWFCSHHVLFTQYWADGIDLSFVGFKTVVMLFFFILSITNENSIPPFRLGFVNLVQHQII